MKKLEKNQGRLDQLQLSAAILAQWRRPVASSEALDLLHWAMGAVMYQRIAMAVKMAIFAGVFVDCCLYACCPGGRWGDTERVVAQCRHPVASVVALDTLHQAMPTVSLRRIHKAFKMGCNGGAFVSSSSILSLIITVAK